MKGTNAVVKMELGVLLTALKALKEANHDVTLHLPDESPWVSLDYGGAETLRGKVMGEPTIQVFDEYEACWVIWFKPYSNPLTNPLLNDEGQLWIRVEDIITLS